MNINCNANLPTNAVNVSDLAPGMTIRAPFSGEAGTVESVSPYYYKGRVIVKFTSGNEVRANLAGTFRMVDAPANYNYHTGHGCPKDC